MAHSKAPIVQAEFLFFTKGRPIRDVIEEVFDRTLDGGRALYAVRFHDVHEHVHKAITRSSICYEAESALHRALATYSVPHFEEPSFTQLLKIKQDVSKLQDQFHEEAVRFVREELAHIVKTKRPIAIDNLDRSFRYAHGDELHELLVTAKKATVTQLFLFPPNDLLAEVHTSVIASFP